MDTPWPPERLYQAFGLIPPFDFLDWTNGKCCYTSDTPVEADASLALGLSASEGIPPLYAITRSILRRILCPGAGAAAELSEMVRRYGQFERED